jgi:hypothetical protein
MNFILLTKAIFLSPQIADFDLSKPLYESNTFSYADQCWNFIFGHNGSDNYGLIIIINTQTNDHLLFKRFSIILVIFTHFRFFDVPTPAANRDYTVQVHLQVASSIRLSIVEDQRRALRIWDKLENN